MDPKLSDVLSGLGRRRLEPEVMDDPDLGEAEHRAALDGLARLNRFSRSDGALFAPVRQLARELGRPVKLLDVACGGGDQIVRLVRRAQRSGFVLEADGCDCSPVALDVASQAARRAGVEASFFRRDAIGQGLPEGYDVIVCTLFLHHLTDDDAVELLASIEEAGPRLVVIQDLRRTRAGALLAAAASRAMTRSAVVHTDALLSVGAAFEVDEVERLAQRAGVFATRLHRVWPQRWQLEWRPRTRSGLGRVELEVTPTLRLAKPDRPNASRDRSPLELPAHLAHS